ncbi:pimeloyl-ACP methyl ester carboxylesterase [Kibdelosporangium banguiense]|uniref:Pimeloyl-ACP methyl ester carboxylesterase n=1 Tax=Kibdelosporangium banguiense TaxID=1365924 RepID=A0ABS4TQ58_9PSEU|nr:alpha/beta fold hydrolase [Kibdelosporangium banguiense]MBP2326036.1 pimeloyl-ACP methyl ester carboxylesterase [Kibdelosporangium banguiense]
MDLRQHGYAKAEDGTSLAYQRNGTGRPLVLLAGQANNHTWWDRARADFSGSTITMDYRGTGASDKPDLPYSTKGFADDVIAVLDELRIDQADVYGTSMGGRVAQWLAVSHPHRVRRLVLGCTSPGGKHGIERTNEVRRALARTDSRDVLADMMYTPAWRAENPGPYQVLGDPGMPPHAARGHLVASNSHDAWDVLPRITAPTLILHGADDVLTPAANVPLLAHRIQQARTHIFPGARHAYFDECRPLASTLVEEFFAMP